MKNLHLVNMLVMYIMIDIIMLWILKQCIFMNSPAND